MTDSAAVFLLIAASLVGLVLIPLGLPGLWVIALAILGYGWLTDFRTLSAGFILLIVGLALLGEVFESWIGSASPGNTADPAEPAGARWSAG